MVYITGAPGTGKTAFTQALFAELVVTVSEKKRRLDVGHMLFGYDLSPGPGTPAGVLIRQALPPLARSWLTHRELPPIVVGEGFDLAVRPVMAAAQSFTNLLVVHLHCSQEELNHRFATAGRRQNSILINSVRDRCERLATHLLPDTVLDVDSADVDSWTKAIDLTAEHLEGGTE
jgi:hypothetical protein